MEFLNMTLLIINSSKSLIFYDLYLEAFFIQNEHGKTMRDISALQEKD